MTNTIRIGHLSTFYHTAILLMARSDTPERLGAEIDWKLMGTGPAIVESFRKGELDLAYIGLPPAIIGMDRGVDIVCVAGGHMEGTVMAGRSMYQDLAKLKEAGAVLAQFRGKRIGVPGKGSIHDVILKDELERAGLGQDVEIVNYRWADQVTEAVVHNVVAAAVGTPALAIALNRFADGRVLIPPSMLWPNNPSYGIVVQRAFLSEHADLLARFLGLHEEAAQFIRKQPREAARMIADFVGIIDEAFAIDTLKISPKYCAQLSPAFIESTERFIPVLRQLGYISSVISRERIFQCDLIKRIHPAGDHYDEGFVKNVPLNP